MKINQIKREMDCQHFYLIHPKKSSSSSSFFAYAILSCPPVFILCKVDLQSASVEVDTIQLRYGFLCSLHILEFAKAEALGTVGLTVVNQAGNNFRMEILKFKYLLNIRDLAALRKMFANIIFGGIEWKIAN
jgi:hypothetical protein